MNDKKYRWEAAELEPLRFTLRYWKKPNRNFRQKIELWS